MNLVKHLKGTSAALSLGLTGAWSLQLRALEKRIPLAETQRLNFWPFLFSKETDIRELDQVRRQNQGCVLVSENMYRFFRGLAVSPNAEEMLDEIRRTMIPSTLQI